MRAFSIITILALFGAIGALGVQLAGKGLQKLIPAAVLGFAWFTWLLSWAIVAGTSTSQYAMPSSSWTLENTVQDSGYRLLHGYS